MAFFFFVNRYKPNKKTAIPAGINNTATMASTYDLVNSREVRPPITSAKAVRQ